jgi:hypothetical protein
LRADADLSEEQSLMAWSRDCRPDQFTELRERVSFFLPMTEAKVKMVSLMPDQDYLWLSDEA